MRFRCRTRTPQPSGTVDVADAGQDLRRRSGSRCHEDRSACSRWRCTASAIWVLAVAMRRSRCRISATRSTASRRRVRRPVSRGRIGRSSWAALSASRSRGAPPGSSRVSSTCSLLTVWVRVLTTSSRCSTSARKTMIASSTATVWRPAAVRAAMPTEVASASSVLRPCPVDSIRTRAASLAGTSTATIWSAASQLFRGAPNPLAPSIAQVAAGHWAANSRKLR